MPGKAELRGALLMLCALLSVVIIITSFSPGLPGALLLQSLRFHIIAAGLALVVALLAAGSRWAAGLLLILVTASAVHGGSMVFELQARRQGVDGAPAAELRVLSYNVLTGNSRASEAAQHIVDLAPDIAIIMETPGIEAYLGAIADALPYRIGCETSPECDISLHSRLPLKRARMIKLLPFNHQRLVLAEVELEGQTVTIVGIHLSKPYFDHASWIEAGQLSQILGEIEGPVVLAGDFNAAPWSDPMVHLTRRRALVPPPYHPATWPARAGPLGVPIDNMFTSGSARINDIEAGHDTFGSNHRYLLARVGLYSEL